MNNVQHLEAWLRFAFYGGRRSFVGNHSRASSFVESVSCGDYQSSRAFQAKQAELIRCRCAVIGCARDDRDFGEAEVRVACPMFSSHSAGQMLHTADVLVVYGHAVLSLAGRRWSGRLHGCKESMRMALHGVVVKGGCSRE
jgi:hypothetical protein